MTNDVFETCLGLPAAVEDYPFGDDVAVFKVELRAMVVHSYELVAKSLPRHVRATLGLR